MSMLTRKGTLVRKSRGSGRKSSVGRTKSTGSTCSNSTRGTVDSDEYSVPPSPLTKFDPHSSSTSSPARSTIVSYSNDRQAFDTNLEWEAAIATSNQSTPDVFLQLQEANKNADSACEFACRGQRILCKSTFMTGCLILSIILPIIMISMGVKYLNECPAQPKVPVYLLVSGCFAMVKLTVDLWKVIQDKKDENSDTFYDVNDNAALTSRTYKIMNTLLTLFLLVWHGLGTYWVFKVWEPRFTQLLHQPSNWCDKTVYMFAVCQILGLYLFLCLFVLVVCCLTVMYRSSCVGAQDIV
ncbi:transmembrane protein 272-like [Gigantopelta aegis]|uniref:transmembrane protein 272-like n=1 Tax=Gigantopelta aegis TaxID=1735272 RepID=UPI001B88E50E|nr:transmembrane protein 272-like [Gigantopelta aegis]